MKTPLSGSELLPPTSTTTTSLVERQAPATDAPTAYLATLAASSRVTMARSLRLLARLLSGPGTDPRCLPWQEVRHEHVAALRGVLADTYKPSTANLHLSALRGVLKAAWRLGLLDAESLARATDVPSVRGSTLPAGREVGHGEIAALLRACGDSPRGRRNGAFLALGYGSGLRRAELAALDLEDVILDGVASVRVRRGKGAKERLSYLASGGEDLIERWLGVRGLEPGPLLMPVRKGGAVERRRMSAHGLYVSVLPTAPCAYPVRRIGKSPWTTARRTTGEAPRAGASPPPAGSAPSSRAA